MSLRFILLSVVFSKALVCHFSGILSLSLNPSALWSCLFLFGMAAFLLLPVEQTLTVVEGSDCCCARAEARFQHRALKMWRIFLLPSSPQVIRTVFSCMELCRRAEATSKWGYTSFPHFPPSLEQRRRVSQAKLKQCHVDSNLLPVYDLCGWSFIMYSFPAFQRNVERKSFHGNVYSHLWGYPYTYCWY